MPHGWGESGMVRQKAAREQKLPVLDGVDQLHLCGVIGGLLLEVLEISVRI